jgi:hypothetical protein
LAGSCRRSAAHCACTASPNIGECAACFNA